MITSSLKVPTASPSTVDGAAAPAIHSDLHYRYVDAHEGGLRMPPPGSLSSNISLPRQLEYRMCIVHVCVPSFGSEADTIIGR